MLTAKTIVAIAVLGCALNLAFAFPGQLNNDSQMQFNAAVSNSVDDWHPPIMTRLWQLFRPVSADPWPLLVLNTLLYWLGFGLIGARLGTIGRKYVAVVLLVGAMSPIFLYFNRLIITDVASVSGLLSAFGILFWFRAKVLRVPLWAALIAALFLAYGILARSNTLFAAPPLLLYAFDWKRDSLEWRSLVLYLVIAVALVPVTIFTNRVVMRAQDAGAIQRLQIYDIAAISEATGDRSGLSAAARSDYVLPQNCVTPYFWDTILTARCDFLWERLSPSASNGRGDLHGIWLRSIIAHPLAYAQHRLRHFNAETFFMVPAAPQCVAAPEMHDCGLVDFEPSFSRTVGTDIVVGDYMFKNALVWPITWLAFALSLGAIFRADRSPLARAAKALLFSGLFFGATYGLVGIATNARYFFWTMVAVQIAAVILLSAHRQWKRRTIILLFVPTFLVVLIGYIFRIASMDIFLV